MTLTNSTHIDIPPSETCIRPAASPPGKRPEILPPGEAPGHVLGPAWQDEHENKASVDAASQAVTEAVTFSTSGTAPEALTTTSTVILGGNSSTSSQTAPFILTITFNVRPTTMLVDPNPSVSAASMPKVSQPAEAELSGLSSSMMLPQSASISLPQSASISPRLEEERAAGPDPHVGAIVGSILGGIALGLFAAIVICIWLSKGRRPRVQFVHAG